MAGLVTALVAGGIPLFAVAPASAAPARPPACSIKGTSLTPTEREVVKLLAEGLTNPQIAERLYIGRGTVKTHVAHIFAKLGVSTRAELASLATKRTEGKRT